MYYINFYKLFVSVGLVLFSILAPLPFIPLPMTLVDVFVLKMDVYIFVLEKILPHEIANSLLLIPLRAGLLYIVAAEVARIVPFLLYVLAIPAQLIIKSVDTLLNIRLEYAHIYIHITIRTSYMFMYL